MDDNHLSKQHKIGGKEKAKHTDPTHAINGDMFLEPFLNN